MSFIARAGSLIDRGHRIIGILFIITVVQLLWIYTIYGEQANLRARLDIQNNTQSIYVVPNSQSGLYNPAESKLLLSTFIDYFVQNYSTYTPANIASQYKSIRPFLSSKIRPKADKKAMIDEHKAKTDEISSIFVVDKTSEQLDNYKEIKSKNNRYNNRTFAITIKGLKSFVVGGKVLSSKVITYDINVRETKATEANPFGFIITKFYEQPAK